MSIHFTQRQWEDIRKNYALWWEQKLIRPLIKLTVDDAFPVCGNAQNESLNQQNCHDFERSPEEIIDAWDAQLSQCEFLGDAFPFVNFDCFGPGVLAAFCGAKLDNSSGRVWFFPEEAKEIADIHVRYDPNNQWAQRIKEIYRAGHQKWQGQVLMSMPDLGGVLDIAAIFRGSEDLLLDLYDNPVEVKRLCAEIEVAWMEAYEDLNSVLQPMNPGFSDWLGIYSQEPSYVLQSDFSYMISRDMFQEFALPAIQHACKVLVNSIYHLDGIGQLPHLDLLGRIEDLHAIQWVYGDGQPTARHWTEIYQKIEAFGKGIKLEGDWEDFADLSGQISKGLCFAQTIHQNQRKEALKLLGI